MQLATLPLLFRYRFCAAAIASVLLLNAPLLSAQDDKVPTYAPTTVEWLALWGQVRLGGQRGGHSILITAREPYTVRVDVTSYGSGSREGARRSLEQVVRELREEANRRGWQWLKIEESLQDRPR
jgi:hypothetical protein